MRQQGLSLSIDQLVTLWLLIQDLASGLHNALSVWGEFIFLGKLGLVLGKIGLWWSDRSPKSPLCQLIKDFSLFDSNWTADLSRLQ